MLRFLTLNENSSERLWKNCWLSREQETGQMFMTASISMTRDYPGHNLLPTGTI